jgi:hypothetical protein
MNTLSNDLVLYILQLHVNNTTDFTELSKLKTISKYTNKYINDLLQHDNKKITYSSSGNLCKLVEIYSDTTLYEFNTIEFKHLRNQLKMLLEAELKTIKIRKMDLDKILACYLKNEIGYEEVNILLCFHNRHALKKYFTLFTLLKMFKSDVDFYLDVCFDIYFASLYTECVFESDTTQYLGNGEFFINVKKPFSEVLFNLKSKADPEVFRDTINVLSKLNGSYSIGVVFETIDKTPLFDILMMNFAFDI